MARCMQLSIVSLAMIITRAFRHASTGGAHNRVQDKSVRHPVVLVGPLLGQTLEVSDQGRINLFQGRLNLCSGFKSTWKAAWISKNPKHLACGILDQLHLTWDEATNLSSSPDGVKVRVADGWEGLKLRGEDLPGNLINRLTAKGYVKEVDLLPQPYDWRLSVADWRIGAYPKMRALIENATTQTGKKVVLTGLSMAGPFTHGFLAWMREKEPAWATKYVHAWVPVGAPWNGAVNALAGLVGGGLLSFANELKGKFDKAIFECPACKPELTEGTRMPSGFHSVLQHFIGILANPIENKVTSLIQSFPSMYWMATGIDHSTDTPTDQNFLTLDHEEHCPWSPTGKRVETIRASGMPLVLRLMGKEKEARLFEYAMSVHTTSDPGVPVHCVYSHNVKTFTHLTFPTSTNFSNGATITLGDGDGTVQLEGSLDVCDRWPSTVKSYKIPGVHHPWMLNVGQVLDVIVAVATEDDSLKNWQAPKFHELELLATPMEIMNHTSLEANLLKKA